MYRRTVVNKRKVRKQPQAVFKERPNFVLQPEERKTPPTGNPLDLFKNMRFFTPLFPISTRKKLMYYEPNWSLTTVAGIYGQYVYSANGLFDPDFTSTGHQPIGWDQLMLYYTQATCLSSKISLRVSNNGSNAAVIGIALAPDTSALNISNFLENGLNTTRQIDGRGTTGTGERVQTLNLGCDCAKYFGRPASRGIVNDPTLFTTAAANPTEQAYYVIGTYEIGALTDNISMQAEVLIEYDCIFWEPRKAPPSYSKEGRSPPYLALKNERITKGKLVGVSNDEGKRA